MSKIFEGKVSVVRNTKGEVALQRDPNGAWDSTMARELNQRMLELAKELKAELNGYTYWVAPDGTEPVLLTRKTGVPYMALLSKRKDSAPKSKVVKLA